MEAEGCRQNRRDNNITGIPVKQFPLDTLSLENSAAKNHASTAINHTS
jgi:hypothetical protein